MDSEIKILLSVPPVYLQANSINSAAKMTLSNIVCTDSVLTNSFRRHSHGLWLPTFCCKQVSLHHWWCPHSFSSPVSKEKRKFWGVFFKTSWASYPHWFDYQNPLHIWVTGLSRKHISHVLKTLLLTSTVDQCHHSETQACLVTAFVRSNTKPHPNRSNVSNHIKNLKRTENIHLIGKFSASFSAFICLRGLCFAKICFWKSGFTPFGSGDLVFLCMIWPDCATQVSNVTLWRGRLERRRAMTWAHSLLPKTKTLQPLTVHMLLVKREIISHHSLWICSMASKCVCWKTVGLWQNQRTWNSFMHYKQAFEEHSA